MTLFNRFIDKPVQAIVVSLVILLLGAQAMTRLTVRQYPETTSSTITIITPYIGANAELVRGFITTPLEQAIATADGIDYLQSASTLGQSAITARLELNYDPNDAVAQILTKIQQVSNQLPPEAENSIVTVGGGEEQAAMYLAFRSDQLSPSEIADYLTRAVRPRLETLEGVQEAQVLGADPIAMRIWLDPRRMAAQGVSASEVRGALERNNFLAAAGDTKGAAISIPFEAGTNIETVEEFRELVIRETDDALIRLSDIAEIDLGAASYNTSVLYSGEPVVFMGVLVAPTANLLEAVGRVHDILPEIRDDLPGGLEGDIVYDSTVAVNDSINEVVRALVEALAIVAVVIFLFLGTIRSALVPALAMPLAIVGAFFLMQILGYSINLLTLLALILAIGMVVDDGIVIVENASRHIENGDTPEEAAKRTVTELTSAIVAMNIIVVAVFAPIGLMGGLTGALFTEFAYTIAGATLISGVVALTLSPMMCAHLLKQDMRRHGVSRWVDSAFHWTSDRYGAALGRALDARWWVVGGGVLILASIWLLLSVSQRELAPQEDDGFLMLQAQGDPNGSLDQLARWTSALADDIGRIDGVGGVFFLNGAGPTGQTGTSAFGGVILKDWDEREPTQAEILPQAQQAASQSAGLQAVAIPPPPLPTSGGGAPVEFVISSIDPPRAVLEQSERIVRAAQQSGLFAFIESDLKFDRLQHHIEIDRDRAAALGVDLSGLGGDLATMLSGAYVNYFTYDERSYRVIPQVARRFRLEARQIEDYYIGAQDGGLVPLSAIAEISETIEPRQLSRFNQLNSAILSGVPAPGVSLGQAIDFLENETAALPSGYVTDWAGQARQFVGETGALPIAIGLAVMLMFLTLAAQYNSFRDPLVMLVSVPMSIAGALIFFALGVVTLNIYTQIGLLALIGSIIRHGILLVEFANDIQRDEGKDRREAMEKAAAIRLRAILMTTVATFMGLVPLLLAGSGPGAASRFAIGFTLGMGMIVGTIFTLFVVPALYTIIGKTRERRESEAAPGMQPAPA